MPPMIICQLGGILGGLSSFLTETVAPAALDIGKAFLSRELTRKDRRRARDALKAQVRQQSNLLGQGPAVLGQAPIPTGGRVFEPAGFPASIIPPSIAPPTLRPVGTEGFGRAVQRFIPGPPFGGQQIAPPPFLGRARLMPDGTGTLPTEPRFARNPMTGRAQIFVPSSRPGEGMLPIEQAVALGVDTSVKFRFNRITGMFVKVKPRRMNPLNFKALGRARRRTQSALRLCRTMFTEARREKTARVRPKTRKRRKK